jgi:hypothetical protein
MVRDKVALGTIAGLIGAIPQVLINALSVYIGFAKNFDFQLSGSIYLSRELTLTFWGFILGGIVWYSMAAGLGIFTTYFIKLTGKDYWWLKGIIVSNTVMYIFMYGFFFSLEAPKVVPWDVSTNFSILIENYIFGITTGYIIQRYLITD